MKNDPFRSPEEERMMTVLLLIFAGIIITILAHAILTTA